MPDTENQTQKMQMYAAATSSGLQFLCSSVNEIPAGSTPLDDATYRALLAADGKGAKLAIRDGHAVALDWQGEVIDLSKMTDSSSYAKPPTLADLANAAFQKARQQFQDLQMMGQAFGPKMQAYMQALNAIIRGSDTTSTALPTAPSDPTQ